MPVLIGLEEIRELMVDVTLSRADLTDHEVDVIVDHFLDAQLRGRKSHGVARFCFVSQFFDERLGPPVVARRHGAIAVVDAQREIGPLSAAFCVDVAESLAKEHGIGLVGMSNSQGFGALGYWSEALTARGLFGVVMNTMVPECVFDGGHEPVLGVNPISFGAPADDEPIIGDLSTSIATMGELWEARRAGRDLPLGAYVDADGTPTTDATAARHGIVFGGHKGFAIATMVQLLAGSMMGFPMGNEIITSYDAGYLFLAIDPRRTAEGTDPGSVNSSFRLAVEQTTNGRGEPVMLCGTRSSNRRRRQRELGQVEVQDEVLDRLRGLAGGGEAGG